MTNNKGIRIRKFTIKYAVFCNETIKMLTKLSYYYNINLRSPAKVN